MVHQSKDHGDLVQQFRQCKPGKKKTNLSFVSFQTLKSFKTFLKDLICSDI